MGSADVLGLMEEMWGSECVSGATGDVGAIRGIFSGLGSDVWGMMAFVWGVSGDVWAIWGIGTVFWGFIGVMGVVWGGIAGVM